MTNSCIFCKIISKEIPATIIMETDHVIVVEDLHPKAPVHYLIIPKIHRDNILHLEDSDADLAWQVLKTVRELGKGLDEPRAFNLISNNGAEAGQSVHHLHVHFLSGKNLYASGGLSL